MEKGKMNAKDEEILQKNIIFIKDHINPEDILDHLVQSNVINFDEQEIIKSQNTKSEKMDKLIRILRFAGPNVLGNFIGCLRKSNYGFAADQLCREHSGSRYETETLSTKQEEPETIKNIPSEYNAENAKTASLVEKRCTYENAHDPNLTDMNPANHNVSDGPVKPVKDVCIPTASSGIETGQMTEKPDEHDELASGYDVIPEEDTDYDIPQFPDTTGLSLKIPFDDNSLKESKEFSTSTELISLPGWCPRINDTNHAQIVMSLKDGGYFIWFSQQKATYIITLRTDQHKEDCIYVKVKTRTVGSDTFYRISREFETKSLPALFKNYIDKGLPLKFIKK